MKRILVLSFVALVALPCLAQEVLLRHRFSPGQSGKAMTEVQMQGDSFLTGQKAATQLRMQMLRDFRVGSIDSTGNVKMDVTVQRLQTQGKMDNASFNRDLSGAELQQVMFGGHKTSVEVSPLGHVQGGDSPSFKQLGISLPSSLDQTGGFEIPTFPVEPVHVGDMWTENGSLLRGFRAQREDLSDKTVYRLRQINPTADGRVAVIRYKKTTDLSGLNLGGSVQIGGLVIQLEGEIEFNIDQGAVIKTTQQGLWNLNMNLSGQRNKTNLNQQGMKIQIHTQFRWGNIQRPQQSSAPDPIEESSVLNAPEIKEIP
ncbi:MAG: hypothetical protein ABIH23_34860 [bacterium]